MDLNQLTVDVTDLERSAKFYELLGMTCIVWSPPRYARFEAMSGSSTLSLHCADNISSSIALYFETDDVDSRVESLEAVGVIFESQPVDQTWRWREAWMRDPDGHRICIYHAGLDRRFPPWRISVDGEEKK